MKSLIFAVLLALTINHTKAYNASVISYSPQLKPDNVNDTLLTNAKNLFNEISKDVQIVVFPEYGLTSDKVINWSNFSSFAVVVPELYINLCSADYVHKVIRDIACMAKEKSIYIVANLLEKANGSSAIYNTNLVFHKNSSIIAKYRKINLFGIETSKLSAGNRLVTFDTDFGATFGIFTCYDILFKYPSVDIFNNEKVTNIVFPTAWYSQLPLLGALAVQEGYAAKHGINLLAAEYQKPEEGASGSGIFGATGKKKVFVSSTSGTTTITTNVDNISVRRPEYVCRELAEDDASSRGIIGSKPSWDNLKMQYDISSNGNFYNFASISKIEFTNSANLCSKDEIICCDFKTEFSKSFESIDVTFKFMVYSNGTAFGCAIVSCTNPDDSTTCTRRNEKANEVIFKEISIKTTTIPSSLIDIPSTLSVEYVPISTYTYCPKDGGHIEMKANNTKGILSFGFYGVSGAPQLQFNLILIPLIFILSKLF